MIDLTIITFAAGVVDRAGMPTRELLRFLQGVVDALNHLYASEEPGLTADLPDAATAGAGAKGFVSDATAPIFAAALVGGGTVASPVYSDGTIWRTG